MDWKQLLSYENLELIGTMCGAIMFTIFISFKTFMARLDKKMADKKENMDEKQENKENDNDNDNEALNDETE